jgi:hypothetical protein
MKSVCCVCGSQNKNIFTAAVLDKYNITYLQCENCELIQPQQPHFWISEAYNSPITSLDIGIVWRNIYITRVVISIARVFFNTDFKSFVDFGGGYGMLVRMMRDNGFDFYRYDTYCDNLFAKHFDIIDNDKKKYELLTAFELFEHLSDPIVEIQKMFELSDNILFSTLVQPQKVYSDSAEWWYFMPETGQHLSIYSVKTLNLIAKKFECNYYTDGKMFHLFTRKKISNFIFKLLTNRHLSYIISPLLRKKTLVPKDLDLIRKCNSFQMKERI